MLYIYIYVYMYIYIYIYTYLCVYQTLWWSASCEAAQLLLITGVLEDDTSTRHLSSTLVQ